MNKQGRQELRPHLRAEQLPSDAVVVVRGGPATLAKLRDHARRTNSVYVLDGLPLWGVSVFCALDDIGYASVDDLLRRFAAYRMVHLPRVADLHAAGFDLLPSFRRPHFTVRLASDADDQLQTLLDALGPAQTNPYHGGKRPGRR